MIGGRLTVRRRAVFALFLPACACVLAFSCGGTTFDSPPDDGGVASHPKDAGKASDGAIAIAPTDAGSQSEASADDGGDAAPLPKKVFLTSKTFNGSLGGLEGADKKCQDAATAAGLSGTYKAWLSTVNDSPSTRFTKSTAPYVLARNPSIVIANDWAGLTSGTLLATITLTETNTPPPAGNAMCPSNGNPQPVVWTATNADGTPFAVSGTCSDWTSTSGNGSWGDALLKSSGWTSDCSGFSCAQSASLYCFEQ